MTPEIYEAHLARLLLLIQGKTWPFSQGLCTYPTSPEVGQQELHAALLDLEYRGHVYRKLECPAEGWIGWMPREPATPPAP